MKNTEFVFTFFTFVVIIKPMEYQNYLVFLFSSIGILNGIAILGYFLLEQEQRELKDKLFLLIVLAITIRVLKSVLMYYFKIPYLVKATGLFALASIGPLLYFYLCAWFNKTLPKQYWKHLVFPAFIFLLGLFPMTHKTVVVIPYVIMIYAFITIYIVYGVYWLIFDLKQKEGNDLSKSEYLWIYGLTAFIGCFVFSYLNSLVFKEFPYLTGSVLYTFGVYMAIFYIVKNKKVLKIQKKYKSSKLNEKQKKELFEKLSNQIVSNQLFLNEDLNLKTLAQDLEIPERAVSQIVNEIEGKNFKDFINDFRIKEACRKLKSSKHIKDSIAMIAYESGFNSLSTFNAVFRKKVGESPSDYRSKS